MILDSNILIKLERETGRGQTGPAVRFFQSLQTTRLCITPTIAGELACGTSMAARELWGKLIAPYEILPMNKSTGWHYGCLYRHLSSKGQLIGTNDLWIAATALTHEVPLATGNINEFQRVPELHVIPLSD